MAGKAGPALSRYWTSASRTSSLVRKAASLGRGRENVIHVLRDGTQARDEVLIKYTLYRLLDASGAARLWLP